MTAIKDCANPEVTLQEITFLTFVFFFLWVCFFIVHIFTYRNYEKSRFSFVNVYELRICHLLHLFSI